MRAATIKVNNYLGISLVFQWLRLCASTAEDADLITDGGTNIPHAPRCGQKKKERKENS